MDVSHGGCGTPLELPPSNPPHALAFISPPASLPAHRQWGQEDAEPLQPGMLPSHDAKEPFVKTQQTQTRRLMKAPVTAPAPSSPQHIHIVTIQWVLQGQTESSARWVNDPHPHCFSTTQVAAKAGT